jgi:hypothetical protein
LDKTGLLRSSFFLQTRAIRALYISDNSGDFMKLASSPIALAFLLCSSLCVLGADKPADKSKTTKPAKVEKARKAARPAQGHEQVALTGSYIKRDVRRNGVVTDGPDRVYVLDSQAIRNSGAADLRELLVLRGLSR